MKITGPTLPVSSLNHLALLIFVSLGCALSAAESVREVAKVDNQVAAPATISGQVSVVLSEAAELTDPDQSDYKDALVAAVGTITKGTHKGQKIKILTLGMRDRKILPVMKKWQNGSQLEVKVSDLMAKKDAEPEIARTDTMDEVEDLTMIEYWADVVTP